jgi:hypothetical protein
MSADPEQDYFADGLVEDIITAHAEIGAPADFKIESTTAKITSADQVAVVARKQRRPCIESGGVATTDAVAARIAAVIIARRVAPACVRIIVAIVVIVVPRRGGSGDYSRQQSVPGYRPPGLPTRNPGNPDWGRRSIDPRLSAFDSQPNSAMFRPTERQQRRTRNGRGCDYDSF